MSRYRYVMMMGWFVLSTACSPEEERSQRYHQEYVFNADRTLRAEPSSSPPPPGSIARQLESLRDKRVQMNESLQALDYRGTYRERTPDTVGIFPLTVTRFTCSCEHDDADHMCEELTARLGNLRVITRVPFMRKADMVMGIRSQGLVDPAAGTSDTIDTLFNGGIYWEGHLTDQQYAIQLRMFKSGKDQCIGKLEEAIDLTQKVKDIDPGMYQCEVAYHFQKESTDAAGQPTLPRVLSDYCTPEQERQVTDCYTASAAFAATSDPAELSTRADRAREVCQPVPAKRYYRAYDALLKGIRYEPD
ncbi:hypothetical protein ACN28S_22505 [Cystobacter fuscus]